MLRVAVSNVRIPRSQSMTRSLPPARTYSAAASHSSIDDDMPRLRSTAVRVFPTSLRSSKFCMFRAPIWSTSASRATASTSAGWSTSVTMGSPFWRPASCIMASPSKPRPWKSYGSVRGLKHPPRSICPPARRTPFAEAKICSRLSTEHGPAMRTGGSSPPTRTPPTSMIVSGRSPRSASL